MQHRQVEINEETTSTRGGFEICLAENSESYWPSSHQQSRGIFENNLWSIFIFKIHFSRGQNAVFCTHHLMYTKIIRMQTWWHARNCMPGSGGSKILTSLTKNHWMVLWRNKSVVQKSSIYTEHCQVLGEGAQQQDPWWSPTRNSTAAQTRSWPTSCELFRIILYLFFYLFYFSQLVFIKSLLDLDAFSCFSAALNAVELATGKFPLLPSVKVLKKQKM